MSPLLTFFLGLGVLILFCSYFLTEGYQGGTGFRKNVLGSCLTALLLFLCIASVWPPKQKIHLGLDLKGGTAFLIQLVRENGASPVTTSAQEQAVEVIRSRVDKFGVGEPVISPVGQDQILVQIPGLDAEKVTEARDQLQRVAKLEFHLVNPHSHELVPEIEAGKTIVPPGFRLATQERSENAHPSHSGPPSNSRYNALLDNAPSKDQGKKITEQYLIRQKADLSGDRVVKAFPYYDQQGWGVSLQFSNTGKKEFGDLTSQHIGEQLAILLDGKIVSAPVLRQAIYEGHAQISGGSMDEMEARNLASVLENPLQTPVKILEERSVSATLGVDSIRSGIISGLVGLGLTALFVLLYYRLIGVIAWLSLLVNIVLIFGVMSMFNFVLTLPGIAGLILTIATAIDANVLIYERLREELATGKNLKAAIAGAFHKALSSIVDANVTTLITSVILFWLAAGPVKGFAVTLTVGIIASLFSALVVTRTLLGWSTGSWGLKKVRMLNIIPDRQFNFMGKARVCIIASAIVIFVSIAAFVWRGKDNFGIDFRGGDLLIMTSQQSLTSQEVRHALSSEFKDSVIQMENKGTEHLIEIRSTAGTAAQIENELRNGLPNSGLARLQAESVGGLVGKQLATHSLTAFGLGILGILIYISLRFEFSFALGAIVALLHDVLITLGVFALLQKEISLVMIGAILTIAGYSINDTIVVFDRIRSGLHEGRQGSVRDIMNASINETLGRTILTSGATFITVAALYIGGGPVLRDFALAMLIGIIVGTYSSIFVAAPIVLWSSRRRSNGDLREQIKPKSKVSSFTSNSSAIA